MWGGCRSDALEKAQLLAAIHASTLDVGCPTTREDSPSPSSTAVGSEACDLAECGAQSDMCLAALVAVPDEQWGHTGRYCPFAGGPIIFSVKDAGSRPF